METMRNQHRVLELALQQSKEECLALQEELTAKNEEVDELEADADEQVILIRQKHSTLHFTTGREYVDLYLIPTSSLARPYLIPTSSLQDEKMAKWVIPI